MRIQACLNGARPVGFHPSLPASPEALAREAAAVAAAGACGVHVHPRDEENRERLSAAVIGPAVSAIRAAAPHLPVSVSTGEWIEGDDDQQVACVASWAALDLGKPDEASVNLSERNAPVVIATLMAGGIGVEAGLATPDDARRLLGLGVAPACRRILIEIDDLAPDQAMTTALSIMALLDGASVTVERQLHGFGRSVWPMFDLAVTLGLMGRLGLEDGELLPDWTRAEDNAALIAAGLKCFDQRRVSDGMKLSPGA
ncbi:3-keto-5-aminohexanoate cleavage protein [Acetobacteraceae bacterium H6797]|nr:3-keto-5-aminohexanoate cleavage protein [Acetobacteraceae bacterium H6797]